MPETDIDEGLDELDREYLTRLVTERDDATASPIERAYKQGRIDEYCAQNAIGIEEAGDLELRLPAEDDESLSLGPRL